MQDTNISSILQVIDCPSSTCQNRREITNYLQLVRISKSCYLQIPETDEFQEVKHLLSGRPFNDNL